MTPINSYPEATPGSSRSSLCPELQRLIHKLEIRFVEPKYLWYAILYELPHNVTGIYCYIDDVISVRQDSVYDVNHVFLHELIHWTGHPERLNRTLMANAIASFGQNEPSAEDYSTEEVTAEMGALGLAIALNISPEAMRKRCGEYVAKFPLADILKARDDAKRAADYVLGLIANKGAAA